MSRKNPYTVPGKKGMTSHKRVQKPAPRLSRSGIGEAAFRAVARPTEYKGQVRTFGSRVVS